MSKCKGKGKGKNKDWDKQEQETTQSAQGQVAAPVDTTDTIAVLTPYIEEVDLWPPAPPAMVFLTPSISELPVAPPPCLAGEKRPCTEAASPPPEAVSAGVAVVVRPRLNRNDFLKEAKSFPSSSFMRYLENAVCDMR
jgi:hypothetical protein